MFLCKNTCTCTCPWTLLPYIYQAAKTPKYRAVRDSRLEGRNLRLTSYFWQTLWVSGTDGIASPPPENINPRYLVRVRGRGYGGSKLSQILHAHV